MQYIENFLVKSNSMVTDILISDSKNTSIALLNADLINKYPFSIPFVTLSLVSVALHLSSLQTVNHLNYNECVLKMYELMIKLENKGYAGEFFYKELFEQKIVKDAFKSLQMLDTFAYDYLIFNVNNYLPFVDTINIIL